VIVEVPRYVTAIGSMAAICTTLSFVPQLARTWRSRRAGDMSTLWLALFTSGVSLWLIYGLLLPSMPIIVANAATLALILAIITLKFRYRERR
jgi:MtN3 and saliva related transmembrane protein